MKLRDYVIRRIFLSIPVIIGVLAITFVLAYVVGNPLALYVDERTSPDAYAAIRLEHGLDEPIYVQFFLYLRNLFSGDWGYSNTARMDVIPTLQRYFPATIELALVSMVIAVVIGIPLGIICWCIDADLLVCSYAEVSVLFPVLHVGINLPP
ncbi:MAG: hypothetical protein ACW992_13380 [Candidatus Thorarchaeota archaeon]|jgi:peptide/nickel transport system permease protein